MAWCEYEIMSGHGMSTHGVSTQTQPNRNQFGKPVSGSASVIINHYKSPVKLWCDKNNREYFKWQTRFHDHIIRNETSFQTIVDYIKNNPAKWKEDKFYKE
jgi:putative transposase